MVDDMLKTVSEQSEEEFDSTDNPGTSTETYGRAYIQVQTNMI